MKKFIKNNIKVLISFILGSVIFGTIVYAATGPSGSDVSYSNTSSKLTSTNAKAAIDELNEKVKTKTLIDIDFGTLKTNSSGTILASSKGIYIKRNNKVHYFRVNNEGEEENYIQQVFSDGSCLVRSLYVRCSAPDFTCTVDAGGSLVCRDNSSKSECYVGNDNFVDCS